MAANEQEEFEFRARAEHESALHGADPNSANIHNPDFTLSKLWDLAKVAPGNAVQDVKSMAMDAIPTATKLIKKNMTLPSEVVTSGIKMAQGTPFSQTSIGEDVSKFADIEKGVASNYMHELRHPLQSLSEHPVNTVLDAIAIGGGVSGAVKSLKIPDALESLANVSERRALGLTKRNLNTEYKIGQAQQASKEMLKENLHGPLDSAPMMLEKTNDMLKNTAASMDEYLSGRGVGFDPGSAIRDLKAAMPKQKGGLYDPIRAKYAQAMETVAAHGTEPISYSTANKIKGLLQDAASAAYNRDVKDDPVARGARDAARVFKDNIDKQLQEISTVYSPTNRPSITQKGQIGFQPPALEFKGMIPGNSGGMVDTGRGLPEWRGFSKQGGESPGPKPISPTIDMTGESKSPDMAAFDKFQKDKTRYGAASTAKHGLVNRVSSEMGNRRYGLTDIPFGVGILGEAVASNFPAAVKVALLGLAKKGVELYGDQTLARGSKSLAEIGKSIHLPGIPDKLVPAIIQAALASRRKK